MDELIENFRRYPFIRLFIPLCIGICWQHYTPSGFQFTYLILFLFASLIAINFSTIANNYHFRWLWGAMLFVLMLSIGCKLVQLQQKNSSLPMQYKTVFAGVVTSNLHEREHTYRLDVLTNAYCDTNRNLQACKEHIVLYLLKDSAQQVPKAGDVILFKTHLNEIASPQNPNEFNYKAYMARQGVFASAFVSSPQLEIAARNQLPFYRALPLQIQQFVFNSFKQNGITDNELAVITALTIGDKQYLDKQLKQSYASAGVMHLLAVSGLHVGIIFGAISFLLSFLNTKHSLKIFKGIVILIVLFLYAAVVGFTPSVTRAVLMFSFFTIGRMWGRQRNTYNIIAASAFVICIFSPYSIFDVGFQLSYAAVLGIVYFQPKLYGLVYFKSRLINKLWGVICVTLAAQLSTTPIVLYYFHQFPVYFLPANLVLIFFVTLIIYAAILLLALSWIPFVATAVSALLAKALSVLNTSVTWVEALPGSVIDGVYINTVQYAALIVAIVFIAFYWLYRNIYLLRAVLILFIITFGVRVYHKVQINNQQLFTVYSTSNSTFINFIDGQAYCLRDSLHIADNYDYQTKNNLIKNGFSSASDLKMYTVCDSLPFFYHNFGSFGGQTLYFADGKLKLPKNKTVLISVDYLLISNQTRDAAEELLALIYPEKCIIIDSSTPTWKARQWKDAASVMGISCHWIRQDGAFTANFSYKKHLNRQSV